MLLRVEYLKHHVEDEPMRANGAYSACVKLKDVRLHGHIFGLGPTPHSSVSGTMILLRRDEAQNVSSWLIRVHNQKDMHKWKQWLALLGCC